VVQQARHPDQRFLRPLGEALRKNRDSPPACGKELRHTHLKTVSTQDQALGEPAMLDALKAHGTMRWLISKTRSRRADLHQI